MTSTPPNHAYTHEGMAHFADTGPAGTRCGQCIFYRYKRESTRETFNPKTNTYMKRLYATKGCKKFYQLTGRHGPEIDSDYSACKYFEGYPPAPAST